MRLPRSGNFYFTVLFLVFLLFLIGTALTYNKKANMVPLVIGIPAIVLVFMELIRDQSPKISKLLETDVFESKKMRMSQTENQSKEAEKRRKEINAILTVIGTVLFVMLMGFLITIPVFVFFYILLFAHESWWKALFLAAGTWAFTYVIFCVIMEIKFPWGFLF